MIKIKIFTLLLLISSCAQSNKLIQAPVGSESLAPEVKVFSSYKVSVPENLADENSVFVKPVIKYWNDSIGEELFGDTGFPIEVKYVESLPNEFDYAAAIAWRSPTDCKIEIKHEYNAIKNLLNLIAHEFGHCIGFNHSTFDQSIMWFESFRTQKITTEIKRIIESNKVQN
ncbi:MAG: matrixin family metalloprotease [Pseudobdellovibrionaceae bacterium]